MSEEQRRRHINRLNTATVYQHSNSECLLSEACEQPSTTAISEQPLSSTISKQSSSAKDSELHLTPVLSEESSTSAVSGQELTSASTGSHSHARVAMTQDITIGRFAGEQSAGGEVQTLSVCLKDAVASTHLPYTTVEGIWKKATLLVSEVNAVVPAPGLGPKEKMVKSKSGSTPHLIC